MPSRHLPKSQGGFTIMEVGLAATVLALTLTGMIEVIETGTKMLDVSRRQQAAEQIIHSEIDQLRLQSWNTIAALPNAATPVTSGSVIYLDPSATSNFTCTYQSQLVPDAVGATIPVYQVTFTVSWVGITGLSYQRVGTTFVGKNGLQLSYQRS
jgi:Tfp pilus assembly protein PilV